MGFICRLVLLAALLARMSSFVMAALPYTPTTLISSSSMSDAVFLFQEAMDSGGVQFLLVNASQSLSSSDIRSSIVTAAVPFAADGATPFTAFADNKGVIYAFAGNCSDGASGASVWVFESNSNSTQGTWEKKDIMTEELQDSSSTGGANYLASGMAFSSTINGDSELYLFGGMCPNSSDQTIDTWQAGAQYSNNLFVLEEASGAGPLQYMISTVSSRGPPIAEAGFSMTPLSPTFFNSSSGDVTQQQNFVLLGGQTDTAFINMSQVALFSLPEESWSFIPVNEPVSATHTDLAIRDTSSVDPRSGHTAVLSGDGQSIILFGGWVGDVTSAASPQLAVLEIGRGYGGNGEWQWVIPSQHGDGPGSSGLYGHGAVILPGNVLMITGGFTIPASQNKLFKRTGPVVNTDHYFFNVTSSSWITDYTNPTWVAAQRGSSATQGQQNSSKEAGLGAGLGVGLGLVIALIVSWILYRRRRRRQSRAVREKDLQGLSLGTGGVVSPSLGFGGVDGRGGEPAASQWISEQHRDPVNSYPWAPTVVGSGTPGQGRSSEAERTGLLFEIPSPTRGLRRSLHSRGNYWYEDGQRSRGSGQIHSIDEREEYETDGREGNNKMSPEMIEIGGGDLISTAPILDPFRDPEPRHLLDGSRSPSPPSPARERELEIQTWTNDWEAAGNLMQTGRLSPDKSDRTSSTLSDVSSRSMVSAVSVQPSLASISRSISQRSAALFSSRPLSSSNRTNPQWSLNEDGPGSSSLMSSFNNRRSHSLTTNRPIKASAEDISLATTSFPALQAEGQALFRSSPVSATGQTQKRRRSAGWMGSIRRSIQDSIGTGSNRNNAPSFDRSTASSPTKRARIDDNNSGSNSVLLPQRSASAGALLWRRQQGAKDWGAETSSNRHSRANTMGSSSFRSDSTDDEEWDIESAVERRVVQMMFTVPKEKLRVVNASPGGDGDGDSVEGVEREASVRIVESGKGKGKEAEETGSGM